MNKEDKISLKNLSRYRWTNPNTFNAVTAVVALLVALIGIPLLAILVAPFVSFLSSTGLGLGAISCITTIIVQVFIFLVAFTFCKIKKVSPFGGRARLAFDLRPCLPALALSMGTFFLLFAAHNQFSESLSAVQKALFGSSMMDGVVDQMTEMDAVIMVLFSLIFAPVLPSICEELLFRGVILDGLREIGNFFAIITSGLLFALFHGNYSQLLLQFIIGCEMGFVVVITGNYFTAMVMHFVNNLIAVLYTAIVQACLMANEALGNFVQASFILLGAVLLCLAVIYYYKLLTNKNENPNGSFLFYKPIKLKYPCCLLQKGVPINYCFPVDYEKVKVSDNSDFLFFNGKKFSHFTKKSNKILFWVMFGVLLAISIGLVIFDFFSVG